MGQDMRHCSTQAASRTCTPKYHLPILAAGRGTVTPRDGFWVGGASRRKSPGRLVMRGLGTVRQEQPACVDLDASAAPASESA